MIVFASITDKIRVLSYAVSCPLQLNDKLRSSCGSANTPREVNVKPTLTRYVCWMRCEPVRISSRVWSHLYLHPVNLETGTITAKCGRLYVVPVSVFFHRRAWRQARLRVLSLIACHLLVLHVDVEPTVVSPRTHVTNFGTGLETNCSIT